MIVTPEQMNIPSKIGNFVIQQMSWNNFPAKGPEGTWFLAHIYWNITYNVIQMKGNGFKVQARANISKNSWVNNEYASRRLLQHEYGHYLICCLAGLTFRKRANEAGKKITDLKQYQQYCQKLLREVISNFCRYQKKYDEQTYHYINQDEQKQWEKEFAKKFNDFYEEQKANEQVLRKKESTNLPQIKKESRQKVRGTSIKKPVKPNGVENIGKNIPKMKKEVNKIIEKYNYSLNDL